MTDRGIGPDDAPRGHIDDFAVILCTREKEGVDLDGFGDFAGTFDGFGDSALTLEGFGDALEGLGDALAGLR